MAELYFLLRLVHLVSGVAWLGEVVTINFVLLPALFQARADDRATLLTTVFPHVFRLATVLGGLAVLSGLALLLWTTRLQPLLVFQSAWGWRIVAGGTLGGVLYLFHLFQESGAERSLATRLVFSADEADARALMRHLAIFPRAGMLVLLLVVALMSAAAHLA